MIQKLPPDVGAKLYQATKEQLPAEFGLEKIVTPPDAPKCVTKQFKESLSDVRHDEDNEQSLDENDDPNLPPELN